MQSAKLNPVRNTLLLDLLVSSVSEYEEDGKGEEEDKAAGEEEADQFSAGVDRGGFGDGGGEVGGYQAGWVGR